MTLSTLIYPRLKNLPPVSTLLALSCLVVSIPLLVSPTLYAILGFNDVPVNNWWQSLTSSFAHGNPRSTDIAPLPHLIGNFLVIVLLGALSERILGSGRFFLLTVATLTTHTLWKIWWGGGNGASGFCWGYVVIVAPIFLWDWQRRRKQVFRDPLYLGVVFFSAFMVFGVAAVLGIRGRELWNGNGTNQAHAVSMLTALPFVFLWRTVMRENWELLQNNIPIESGRPLLEAIAIGASIFLFAFNLTFAMIGVSALRSGSLSMPQIVSMTPGNHEIESLNKYHQQVTIQFDRPMELDIHIERLSISWLDENGKLDYTFHWVDPQTLVFTFSREVYGGETILVIANVRDRRWSITIPVEIKFQ